MLFNFFRKLGITLLMGLFLYKGWRYVYIYPNVPMLSWVSIFFMLILLLILTYRNPYVWILSIVFYLLSLLHLTTYSMLNETSSFSPISDIFPRPIEVFEWVIENYIPYSIIRHLKTTTYYLYSIMLCLSFSKGAFKFYRIDRKNMRESFSREEDNILNDVLDYEN